MLLLVKWTSLSPRAAASDGLCNSHGRSVTDADRTMLDTSAPPDFPGQLLDVELTDPVFSSRGLLSSASHH